MPEGLAGSPLDSAARVEATFLTPCWRRGRNLAQGRNEAALGAGVLRYALGASSQVAARAPERRDRDPATPDDVSGARAG